MPDNNKSSLPADRFLEPLRRFGEKEASSGIILLFCTVVALVWANSPWSESYFHLWETKFTIGFQDYKITESLHLWVNDGLMAVFFFVVGLEIKREILVGELSNLKQAILPIAAAAGGMIVPALIYFAFNTGKPSAPGWGIPMATDIAFALGVLALLGKRVPLSLKIFLTALAIVDDIGAVLVIALFYTSQIVWLDIYLGAGFLALLAGANMAGIRNPVFYAVFGIGGLWTAFFLSGVHPTVAGVLAAFAIPARTKIHARDFLNDVRLHLDDFETSSLPHANVLANKSQFRAINEIAEACDHAQTPLQKLEHALHPWVAFFIMPLFALVNAGVSLNVSFSETLLEPVSIGIILGLFFGKQFGILFFSWLVVKIRLADLPSRVTWKQLYGVGILGGVGFTMSLFISGLAFSDPILVDQAKIGILFGSLISGTFGYLYLRKMGPANGSKNTSQ